MTKQILDDTQISRSLTRIAHEILERNKGANDIVLLGIKTRGEFLAARLSKKLCAIDNVNIPCGTINITAYRDDAKNDKRHEDALNTHIDLNGKHVVIVDDVLFTGRTIRASLDAILNHARPDKISLAVLIDRGHRELPIRADYVGKNIPTSKSESIGVFLKEVDDIDAVTLNGA